MRLRDMKPGDGFRLNGEADMVTGQGDAVTFVAFGGCLANTTEVQPMMTAEERARRIGQLELQPTGR